jgi:uncharacterized protein (AIM24 family)
MSESPPPSTSALERAHGDALITGEIAQAVRLTLGQGEEVWASRGSLVSYSDGIAWKLKIPGGVGAAVGRAFAGEGMALTRIRSERAGAEVVLGAGQAGKVHAWDLASAGEVLCTRGSFLAATGDVEIIPSVAKRAGAAFFGGAGVILQRIRGRGTVFVHGSGDFVHHELTAGQILQVSTGNLAALGAAVDYDIVGVKGCRNMLFGGEGLFMARLKGPGPVLLQTLKRLPATPRGRGGGGGG